MKRCFNDLKNNIFIYFLFQLFVVVELWESELFEVPNTLIIWCELYLTASTNNKEFHIPATPNTE